MNMIRLVRHGIKFREFAHITCSTPTFILKFCTQATKDAAGGETSAKPPFRTGDLVNILNPSNNKTIEENIKQRKGVGDIHEVIRLYQQASKSGAPRDWSEFNKAALLLPNTSSEHSPIGSTPKEIFVSPRTKVSGTQEFINVVKNKMDLLKYGDVQTSPSVFGPRSYFMLDSLAILERALVYWTLDRLRDKGWQYVSVPDQLPESLINSCGFITTGRQNQIFKLREKDFYTDASQSVKPTSGSTSTPPLCLAGTAEMSLAGRFAEQTIDMKDLPVKVCSFSRCFRAEEAKNQIDKNFYRLYEFTKVEMFAITHPNDSDRMFEEIVQTQKSLIEELELVYRVLEMPTEELGASAYRKQDIEAWMPGKNHWGEITSASNCTDYQSRRLAIEGSNAACLHTLNGTAAAIPRLLISLIEQYLASSQTSYLEFPRCLHPYVGNSGRVRQSPLARCSQSIKSRRWIMENFWNTLGQNT